MAKMVNHFRLWVSTFIRRHERERKRDRADVNLKFPQHVLLQSALDSFFLITSTLQGNLIAG